MDNLKDVLDEEEIEALEEFINKKMEDKTPYSYVIKAVDMVIVLTLISMTFKLQFRKMKPFMQLTSLIKKEIEEKYHDNF